jgi:hypothetical protein
MMGIPLVLPPEDDENDDTKEAGAVGDMMDVMHFLCFSHI